MCVAPLTCSPDVGERGMSFLISLGCVHVVMMMHRARGYWGALTHIIFLSNQFNFVL